MILKKVKIDYDLSVFVTADYTVHEGSCISHQVHELTDIHNEYGGFPTTYKFDNTKIQQLWWNTSQVDYIELGKQLNMEIVTISSILQPPGNIIPIHRDTFFQINKLFPNDTRRKVRANLYLEPWKVGHMIQYKDNGEWHNSTHWSAGEGWLWDSDILHLSANAGMENKFTLQISGFLNE